MNEATIQAILALLPLAQRLLFDVGGELIAINTADVKSREGLIELLEKSKSAGWPELQFATPADHDADPGSGD